jgi:hypothetical protein
MTKKAAKPTKATKVEKVPYADTIQVPAGTVLDTMKVKAVKLDGMNKTKAVYRRLSKIKVGMTVADVLAKTSVSRFDLACAWPRVRRDHTDRPASAPVHSRGFCFASCWSQFVHAMYVHRFAPALSRRTSPLPRDHKPVIQHHTGVLAP